jgi:hypothetical protein
MRPEWRLCEIIEPNCDGLSQALFVPRSDKHMLSTTPKCQSEIIRYLGPRNRAQTFELMRSELGDSPQTVTITDPST